MRLFVQIAIFLLLASMCVGVDSPRVNFFGGCVHRYTITVYDPAAQVTPSYMTGEAQQQEEFKK